jgi:hypothetical protein
MAQDHPQPQELVLTEAETVPPREDATAPNRKTEKEAARGTSGPEDDVRGELTQLAARVGGLKRLKEMIDEMIRLPFRGSSS